MPLTAAHPSRDAEAVVDEVALLEAALREAAERHRAGAILTNSSEGSLELKDFDVAVATYGVQLRAWIDLQVDARLQAGLQSIIEAEVTSRQDVAFALTVAHRVDFEMKAMAETQASLLSVVEGVSEELSQLKASAYCQSTTEALAIVENARADVLGAAEELKCKMHHQGQSNGEAVRELYDLRRGSEDHNVVADLQCLRTELFGALGDLKRQIQSQSLHDETAKEMQVSHKAITNHDALAGQLQMLRHEVLGAVEDVKNQAHGQGHRHGKIVEDIEGLRKWQEDHHSVIGDLRYLQKESQCHRDVLSKRERQVDDLMRQVHQLEVSQTALQRDVQSEDRALKGLQDDLSILTHSFAEQTSRLEARVDAIFNEFREGGSSLGLNSLLESRVEVAAQALRNELKVWKEHTIEDLLGHAQKLTAELRVETSAARKSDASALAALDEQLWLTDQRLGQRIDELAHLHLRHRTVIAERAVVAQRSTPLGLRTSDGTHSPVNSRDTSPYACRKQNLASASINSMDEERNRAGDHGAVGGQGVSVRDCEFRQKFSQQHQCLQSPVQKQSVKAREPVASRPPHQGHMAFGVHEHRAPSAPGCLSAVEGGSFRRTDPVSADGNVQIRDSLATASFTLKSLVNSSGHHKLEVMSDTLRSPRTSVAARDTS